VPCGQSYANAVFFRIGVIAYNLFIGFKRLSCPESWMKRGDIRSGKDKGVVCLKTVGSL